MDKIIERMPDMDQWPRWAREAAEKGQLFRVCMERIAALEGALNAVKDKISQMGPGHWQEWIVRAIEEALAAKGE